MSTQTEMLKKLDERFVLGEITPKVYHELRSRLISSDADDTPAPAQILPGNIPAGRMSVRDSVVRGNITNTGNS